MASFSAELHVAGVVIPLIRCTYSTHQSTDARGRVITKARKSPIDCEADVPEHQVLDAWAADPYKRQEAIIIFRNAATGAAWETLHLKAAYCVSYNEVFVMGDLTSGSYRCFFTLSDPDGWTWNPGGPLNEAAIRPAPGEHGAPPSTAASMPPLRPTTELFQRGYEESLNPINPHRMALWIGYLERRGIRFEIGTPIAQLKLFDNDSVGVYAQHTRTIYLLHPPNTSAFFEEAFHALQHLRNHPEDKTLSDGTVVDAWEYDAKKALLTHAEKLGLSYPEYISTEKQLQQVIDGSYDNR